MSDYNSETGQSSYGASGSASADTAPAMENISEKAAEIKDKVTNFGRKTVDVIDQSRQSAAGALDQTASSLHTAGDKVSGVAHSAADSVQSTADYIRRTDAPGIGRDIRDLVARHPGVSLAAATLLGFFIGRGLRPKD